VLTILVLCGFLLWKGTVVTSQLNLSSAAGYAGPIGAIAIAQVLLLVLAEIDLSAGAVFLFAPWIEYWLYTGGVPLVLSILLAILASALVGGFNGLITVFLRVPSFVTTLATNFILFGGILVGSQDAQVSPVPLSGESGVATSIMGGGQWAEIIWVAALTVVLSVLVRPRRACRSGGSRCGLSCSLRRSPVSSGLSTLSSTGHFSPGRTGWTTSSSRSAHA
jgi:simple sugar transport system permease protein